MKKYIILRYDISTIFFPQLSEKEIYGFYREKIPKLILKVFSKLKMNYLLFGNWTKRIKNIDCVIIFDTLYRTNISKYIKKKNPNCKIIFYYWNVIGEYNHWILNDSYISEIWTFDKKDSEKYHLQWNPQFYTYRVQPIKKNLKYDILFLGRDKGRANCIDEMDNSFRRLHLHSKLIVIKKESDFISYKDYLEIVSESKSLLDILAPGQTGLTLRTMEALFLEKKLITNNADIKNYSFYNKNNIFIIGEDSLDKLPTFLKKPCVKISKEIIEYYDYENWIKRFFESK